MRIAVVGYGRMGREVEAMAGELGHEVVARLDRDAVLDSGSLAGAEAAVEFTLPEAAPGTLVQLARLGVPTVSGTTGWYDHLPRVRAAVAEAGGTLLYAPNFSVGVAVFRRWLRSAAAGLDGLPAYDVSLHEVHHTGKVDHPSGTARLLAETIVEAAHRIEGWTPWPAPAGEGAGAATESGRATGGSLDRSTLRVTSERVGSVPGTHTVTVDGPDDQITLTHTARSRRGFARGAVQAAAWIQGRTGVFTLDDMLDDLLGQGSAS